MAINARCEKGIDASRACISAPMPSQANRVTGTAARSTRP